MPMKVILERQAFLTKLALVAKNTSRGEKTQSGIHSHIYMKLTKGKVGIRCWNGVTMLMSVLADGVLEMAGEGAMLIPAEKLHHIVDSSTTKKITIEEEKETRYIVKANGRSTLNGMPLAEFPEAVIDGEEVATLSFEKFCKRARSVASCAASDSETRSELKGILWNGEYVATDGHKAAVYRGEKLGKGKQFIIPSNTIMLMNDIYKEVGDVEMKVFQIKDRALIFKIPGAIITTALIAGNYPDYSKIVEDQQESKREMSFEKKDMIQILQRARVFEDRNRAVQLKVKEGKLLVQIGNDEAYKEYVKTAKVGEKEIEINIAISTFTDCISNAPKEEVTIRYSTPTKALSVSQKNWTYIMMPMNKGV